MRYRNGKYKITFMDSVRARMMKAESNQIMLVKDPEYGYIRTASVVLNNKARQLLHLENLSYDIESHFADGQEFAVDVYHLPYLVNGNGLAISCAIKVSTIVDNRAIIMVDDIFMAMPKWVQDFYLMHEMWHILLGHLDGIENAKINTIKRLAGSLVGNVQHIELVADAMASMIIGWNKAINALIWTDMYVSGCGNIEIRKRIKHLQKRLYEDERVS